MSMRRFHKNSTAMNGGVMALLLVCMFTPLPAAAFVESAMVGLGTWIASAGGWFFDWAIQDLVLNMGHYLSPTIDGREGHPVGNAIVELWRIVRDLFNIALIFGLIFVGLKMIWNAGDTNTRKTLAQIIGAALLVNFSLFFVQILTDFTNAAAVQIYNLTDVEIAEDDEREDDRLVKISLAFATVAKIGQVEDSETLVGEVGSELAIAFIKLAFLSILGFVLFAGAFLLVARFVVIVLFMVGAPLLFLGWVFPNFKNSSTKYFRVLINYAFVAPIFLFMLFLSLRILYAFYTFEEVGDTEAIPLIHILIQYLVAAGLLIASLIVAKQLGAFGADKSIQMLQGAGKRARVFAGNASLGRVAGLGRATFGRWAQLAADSEGLKENASRGGLRGFAARRALNNARVIGDSSFDARKVGGLGEGLGIGTGRKGGYKSVRDEIAKSEKQYAKDLGSVPDSDQKVSMYRQAATGYENRIAELKARKANETGQEAQDTQKEIENNEKRLAEANRAIKIEKNRRQTGSYTSSLQASERPERIAEANARLQRLTTEFENAQAGEEQDRIAEQIRQTKSLIKQLNKKSKNDGYQSVVAGENIVVRTLRGRTKNENEFAAKQIRKEFEKKIKQTKDDERFESLGEQLAKLRNDN